ncbi:glycosyltransferase [Microbacterium sp. X-17]|uniref:glycosyltransferase family 2 protein n=1 Tax=Microbacterium sp. X-17 TaxID=3144404 RepID=UPI0031F57881
MDGVATFFLVALLVVGVTTPVWVVAALIRVSTARYGARPRWRRHPEPADVAVLIAAHNEELVIRDTVRSAGRLLPMRNVFVVSDGSTDRTAEIAREEGASAWDLTPNRGKAGAIEAAIAHFEIADRFEVLLLLDADTQLDDDYLTTGLPPFADPEVVAVAGSAATLFDPPAATRIGRILVAYRQRVYLAMQYLHKFGQAARWANAVTIVPGFASMYRTRILADVDISAPGLAIEDYNMTFEVHAKHLGRVAFHPSAAVARTQDPATLHDYAKQVRRWNLGFWQTVGRHGAHRGLFWTALGAFLVELVLSSVLLVLVLPLLLFSAVVAVAAALTPDPALDQIAGAIPVWAIALAVVVPDYLLTIAAAVATGRPSYLWRGLVFPLLRILDALLCLQALRIALRGKTDGRWLSPVRRAASIASVVPPAPPARSAPNASGDQRDEVGPGPRAGLPIDVGEPQLHRAK